MSDTVTHRSAREMEIIRSAYRMMANRGSHRMSLRDIADEAGVSKALLLYHFGTKDALLHAAMRWALERTAQRIRERLGESQDPHQAIAALIDAIFIDAEANREFYLFYIDLVEHVGRVPSFGSLSELLTEMINGLYAEVIEDGVGKGVFEVEDVDIAARNMRSIIEGTFLQWIQTEDWRHSHQAWKRHCLDAVLRLVGSRSTMSLP